MRRGAWLLLFARVASADERSLHVRMRAEQDTAPLLHLDTTLIDPSLGSPSEHQGVELSLGPRARFAAEGTWWQSSLSPSMCAIDVHDRGWRGGAELTYDLGWFSLGANVSITQDITGTHRTMGLFAYKRFNLSRWMHAWIALGLSFDSYQAPNAPSRSGTTLGLSLGTTFR